MTLQETYKKSLQDSIQIRIAKIITSQIKKCVGEVSGTHTGLDINSQCAGCGASIELLALIRVMDAKSNVS